MKPFRGFLDAIFDCAKLTAEEIQAQEDAIEEERQNAILNAQPKVMTLAESMMEHPDDTMLGGMKLGNITKVIRRIPATPAVLEISEDPLQDFGTLFPFAAHVTDTAVELVIAFGLVEIKFIPVTYNGNNYLQMEDTELYEVQYKAAVDTLRLKKGERRMAVGDLLFTLDNVDGVKPPIQFTGLQVWLREINKRKLPRSEDDGAILQATNGFKIILSLRNMKMKTINLLTLANGSIEDFRYILPR
ncbi:hypothetical protein SPFM12_00236 [Salmonella phage SPFM12]|nr:hypothetical protein SPFM12_00236 [Salmonella phage SPFM12]